MRTLSHNQTREDILELWHKASQDYQPDAIVAILYGGEVVGETVYEASKIPLYKIIIKRPNRQKIYQRLARWSKFLAWFVYELLFLLDDPYVVEPISLPANKKLLVVDDAIHTGKTLRACRLALKRFRPKEVKVLTITDISGKHLADYSLYTETISFPWSLNRESNQTAQRDSTHY